MPHTARTTTSRTTTSRTTTSRTTTSRTTTSRTTAARLGAAGFAALLLAAGCSSTSTTDSSGTTAGTTAGSTPGSATSGTTIAAGLPSSTEAQLQAVLDEQRTALGFPGVQAGVWTSDGAWIGTSGTAGQDDPREITLADHTRVGSITKTMTVTVILQLAEEGKLSLDDTIGTYVEGIPNGDTATLRNLAAMTSGIPSYTQNTAFTDTYFADPSTVWEPQQLVDVIKGEPPMFAPGAEMYYSNTNTVLLGMVIEQVTGKPVAEVMADQLFGPLGMTETTFPGTSTDLPSPHLSGITEQGDPEGTVKDATNWNPSWAFTAGEAISTLDDLHTWAVALATGEGVLGPEAQAERLESLVTDVPPNTPERAYGLGFGIDNGWIGHTGELPGYNTVIQHNPELGITIVVMVNSDIPVDEKSPATAVFQALATSIAGEATSGMTSASSSGTTPSTTPGTTR